MIVVILFVILTGRLQADSSYLKDMIKEYSSSHTQKQKSVNGVIFILETFPKNEGGKIRLSGPDKERKLASLLNLNYVVEDRASVFSQVKFPGIQKTKKEMYSPLKKTKLFCALDRYILGEFLLYIEKKSGMKVVFSGEGWLHLLNKRKYILANNVRADLTLALLGDTIGFEVESINNNRITLKSGITQPKPGDNPSLKPEKQANE